MWRNKSSLSLVVLVTSFGLFGSNQANALGDEEAAVLFGMAVGGLTAYALKQDREYRSGRIEVYPPRHRHSEPRRSPPRHRDHYVIIDSHHAHYSGTKYRGNGHNKKHNKTVKYQHTYNHHRDAGNYYNAKHARVYKHAY